MDAPIARREGLLVEELDDELVVYDEGRDTACRLNATSALVWRAADGTRSIEELVELLRAEIGEPADEDLVMVTLDGLGAHGLLEGHAARPAEEARLSRRRFIRRVGTVGAAALMLPVVHSMVAPAPAAAQSAGGYCICPPCTCPCAGCATCLCICCTCPCLCI
jgi:hypothetical protein